MEAAAVVAGVFGVIGFIYGLNELNKHCYQHYRFSPIGCKLTLWMTLALIFVIVGLAFY